MLIAPGVPLPAPNPLFPVYAGTRPRVGAVLDRLAVDRANSDAKIPLGAGLSRSRPTPAGSAGATGRDHRRARLSTCSYRVE